MRHILGHKTFRPTHSPDGWKDSPIRQLVTGMMPNALPGVVMPKHRHHNLLGRPTALLTKASWYVLKTQSMDMRVVGEQD